MVPRPAQHLRLDISFNASTGEPAAAYVQVREGTVAQTREVDQGVAFADFDSSGVFLGIELLGPCSYEVLKQLIHGEPDFIHHFVEGVATQPFLRPFVRV